MVVVAVQVVVVVVMMVSVLVIVMAVIRTRRINDYISCCIFLIFLNT